MEKKEVKIIEEKKSSIILENRRKLIINGVIEVVSFNDQTIILNTSLGGLSVKGEGLKMNKLDVQNGDVVIIGTVNSCVYSSSYKKQEKEKLLSRLFK